MGQIEMLMRLGLSGDRQTPTSDEGNFSESSK